MIATRRALAVLLVLLAPFLLFTFLQFTTPFESPYVLPYLLALNEPSAATPSVPVVGRTITVSQTAAAGDFRNISSAVAVANPGDTILVRAGIYREQVNVSKPWITIRGINNENAILDGNLTMHIGISASHAPGISVQFFTIRNYLDEGVFFFKSDHWLMDHIIATNNRNYELFALSSRWGSINNSVAIGGGDSGFYIGETFNCNCVIENSTAYGNAIGYSGTRVDGIVIRDSKFVENSVGISPNTLPPNIPLALTGQWKHPFFASNHTIENTLVEENNNQTVLGTGVAASLGVPIGTGISLAGVYGSTVKGNTITGNNRWGIAEWYFLIPPTGNVYEQNNFSKNGQDLWSDGTSFFGCSSNETASGDLPSSCSVPALLRLTLPNPIKEVELILNLGRPGYIVDAVFGRLSLSLLVCLCAVPVALTGSTSSAGQNHVVRRRGRLLQEMYDGLLVGTIYLAVVSVLLVSLGASDVPSLVNGIFALTLLLTPIAYFLFVTIWFFYGLILDSLGKKTLGEYVLELKKVSKHGERPSFPRIFVKNLLLYLDSLAFGLVGLILILSKRRTLGEIASGVYLVPEKPRR